MPELHYVLFVVLTDTARASSYVSRRTITAGVRPQGLSVLIRCQVDTTGIPLAARRTVTPIIIHITMGP